MNNRMSRVIGACLGGLVALGATQVAHAVGFTQVKPNTLKYNGTKYWRTKAEDARLGAIGRKVAPAVGPNRFQLVQHAPDGMFKVIATDPVPIDSSNTQEFSGTVTGGASGAEGSVTVGGNNSYTGKITAFKLSLIPGNQPGGFRYEANRNAGYLKAIAEQGNRARVITAVWVLVAASETQASCLSGSLSVDEATGSVGIQASGSSCSTSSWSLPPGSVIAYEMTKITSWNNKELVENASCPSGSRYDVRKSPAMPHDRCAQGNTESRNVECALGPMDRASNWYVKAQPGRDTCKSSKGKKDKGVKCPRGYQYAPRSGKDQCTKGTTNYVEASCPTGYVYRKESVRNGGQDVCELRGIAASKPDLFDGM